MIPSFHLFKLYSFEPHVVSGGVFNYGLLQIIFQILCLVGQLIEKVTHFQKYFTGVAEKSHVHSIAIQCVILKESKCPIQL